MKSKKRNNSNFFPTAPVSSSSSQTPKLNQQFINAQQSSSTSSLDYELFLNSKRFDSNIILPSTPRGFTTNAEFKKQTKGNGPRKICGDWSSTLKLLRYVTQSPNLGLHFVSDYSHHYGGYKAKISMENGKFFFFF